MRSLVLTWEEAWAAKEEKFKLQLTRELYIFICSTMDVHCEYIYIIRSASSTFNEHNGTKFLEFGQRSSRASAEISDLFFVNGLHGFLWVDDTAGMRVRRIHYWTFHRSVQGSTSQWIRLQTDTRMMWCALIGRRCRFTFLECCHIPSLM